jgi:hypothetical protein
LIRERERKRRERGGSSGAPNMDTKRERFLMTHMLESESAFRIHKYLSEPTSHPLSYATDSKNHCARLREGTTRFRSDEMGAVVHTQRRVKCIMSSIKSFDDKSCSISSPQFPVALGRAIFRDKFFFEFITILLQLMHRSPRHVWSSTYHCI